MDNTVKYSLHGTWPDCTLWVVLRLCYFVAILLPDSCLQLYLTSDTKQEQKSGTSTLKKLIIPNLMSIKVDTSIHDPSTL